MSATRSETNTLTATTAMTVTITQLWPAIEITNHDSAQVLYVRQDGTTAVAKAAGTSAILPGQSKVIAAEPTGNSIVISAVGNGNTFTVEGVK